MDERMGGKALTRVHVTTTPPGATVTLNGKLLGKAPFTVPVRYRYLVRIYQRRTAFPYPHREERRIEDYPDSFTFEAFLPGHEPARKVVQLNGEERAEVSIELWETP